MRAPQAVLSAAFLIPTFGLVLGGCEREPRQPPVPRPLSVAQVMNADYASQWSHSGRARLVNGQYREAAAPGAATEILVRATEFNALGDLDGDGAGDAVVVLESDPGGSGVFYDLVGVLNRASQPLTLAPVPLGDRVQVSDLSVDDDGTVHVSLVKHGPDDPQCCPTLAVTLRYRLSGDRLVSADQAPSRVSASPVTRKMVHSLTPRAPIRS